MSQYLHLQCCLGEQTLAAQWSFAEECQQLALKLRSSFHFLDPDGYFLFSLKYIFVSCDSLKMLLIPWCDLIYSECSPRFYVTQDTFTITSHDSYTPSLLFLLPTQHMLTPDLVLIVCYVKYHQKRALVFIAVQTAHNLSLDYTNICRRGIGGEEEEKL